VRPVSLDRACAGGLAEQVLVEAPLVPELLALGDLDPLAGTFVEPLGCVLRALDRARLTAGESLLVVGTGSNGLLAIAAAQARGADPVWIREPRAEPPPARRALGAAQHADEPVDVAFVTSARPDAVAGAAAALGPGGTMCLCATTKPGASLGLDAEQLFLREITVLSSWSAGPDDMRAAYRLIAGGQIDPLELVTHRSGLAETARALDLQRRGEAIKAVVVP
jgi:L-iditol 2-dehydrogenase